MNKEKLIPELRFPEFKNEGEWEVKTLGSVAEIITGSTPSTTEPINYNGNSLFVSPADINDNRYIYKTKTTLSEIGFSKTRKIKKNSVLFVCIGSTIGKVAQNKFECATNQQLNSLISNEDNSSDFLYSILDYNSKKIASIAGNHAVPLINKTSFSSIKLNFPSNPQEQNKIATCLSSLDEVIAVHSQKLDLLKDHKKGLMQNLFPNPSASSGGEKVPKYRFKGFEKDGEWTSHKLKDLTKINQGLQIPISERYTEKVENSFFYITNEFLKSNNEKSYYIRNPSENVKCTVEDVLMTRTGNTGQVVTGVTGAFHINFFKIQFDRKFLNKDFFVYFLRLPHTQRIIMSYAGASTIPDLNHSDFYGILIKIPSLKEQQKIASCLSSLDALITAQTDKIEELKLHKKGLMQGLFPKINE